MKAPVSHTSAFRVAKGSKKTRIETLAKRSKDTPVIRFVAKESKKTRIETKLFSASRKNLY